MKYKTKTIIAAVFLLLFTALNTYLLIKYSCDPSPDDLTATMATVDQKDNSQTIEEISSPPIVDEEQDSSPSDLPKVSASGVSETNTPDQGSGLYFDHRFESPRAYLQMRSEELDLPFALLDKIVECESNWRMVKNPYSSAYGYFQIIDSTEKTTPQYKRGDRKFNPYTNIEMGIYLYTTRGTNPWNPSKGCWG